MATIDETNSASRLGSKLRGGLALAQTRIHTIEEQARSQWESLPMQARAAIERLATRIRVGLDLPSRNELVGLVERIEELDQKLEALARRQRAALKAPASTQEEAPVPAAAGSDSEGTEAAHAAPAAAPAKIDASGHDQQAAAPGKPAEIDDEPPRNGARMPKKEATRTKKARSNTAGKTISAAGAKKSAAAGKRQTKGKTRGAGKAGQADKRD